MAAEPSFFTLPAWIILAVVLSMKAEIAGLLYFFTAVALLEVTSLFATLVDLAGDESIVATVAAVFAVALISAIRLPGLTFVVVLATIGGEIFLIADLGRALPLETALRATADLGLLAAADSQTPTVFDVGCT